MKAIFLAAILVPSLQAALVPASDSGSDFKQLKTWLMSNGAQVHDALRGSMTHHGGADIRGVIASTGFASDKNSTLFKVPRKLWLWLENFPTFAQATLPITHECNDLAGWEANRLKLAAAIVTEARQGDKSIHHVHIQHLPSMKDFHSFLPRMMEKTLQQEFSALPLVSTIKEVQDYDNEYTKLCFDMWRKWTPESLVATITWDEILLALTWIRTRCYGIEEGTGTVIVPGTDMLNVARSQDLNTNWFAKGDTFLLETRGKNVKPGEELYESYCQTCDNSDMMKIWGVYMEDNPNPVDARTVACSAYDEHSPMRRAMHYVLDTEHGPSPWKSPRCRPSVFATEQGPLRCSLARLTWEYCAEDWGLTPRSNATKTSSFLSHRQSRSAVNPLSPREDALLVLRSAIRNVPEQLQRGRARRHQGALGTDSS